MDDDDFRRGRPSNHKKFDEATALLAGDALLAIAFDALLDAEAAVPPAALLKALKRLATVSGPRGVIGGQAAEPELTHEASLTALRAMHARKTGALFEAALLLPRDLAGVDPASPRSLALEAFAHALGAAFQVADDLEDAGTEKRAEVSILAYLSPEQAAQTAQKALDSATTDLRSLWGEPAAQGLTSISNEVRARLNS